MFNTIVKKEILEHITGFRFPLFLLICVLLIPLGMYVNNLEFRKRLQDHNEQLRLANEAISKSQMQDVMSGMMLLKGFRYPSALAVFAQGYESTLPRFYEFRQDGFKQGETSIIDESILSVQGTLDFVYIIQMVISVIVLLFASDVVAGEKELGTLRGILSNSIPRNSLLLGKITGGYIALWIPFTTAFLIGIIILALGSFPLFEGDTPARVFFIYASASILMLAYFIIGIMVSASAEKTRTSLVVILLVWTFFQLIVPKVSDRIAAIIHPVRTETAVSLERSLLGKSLDEEKAKELGKQYEVIFGRDHPFSGDPEPSPQQEQWSAAMTRVEQEFRERKSKQLNDIDDAYMHEKRIQQTIATNLSLFSPSAAFSRLITDICGTGEIEKRKYVESAKAYQQVLDTELFGRAKRTMLKFPSGGTALTFSVQPVDFKSLLRFSISSSSIVETLKENWGALLSLGCWLIAPLAMAYVQFLKYDVR